MSLFNSVQSHFPRTFKSCPWLTGIPPLRLPMTLVGSFLVSTLIHAVHLNQCRGLHTSHPCPLRHLHVRTSLTCRQPCRVCMLICPFSWEFCITLDFDYTFLSGKRKYRWPLVTCLCFIAASRALMHIFCVFRRSISSVAIA